MSKTKKSPILYIIGAVIALLLFVFSDIYDTVIWSIYGDISFSFDEIKYFLQHILTDIVPLVLLSIHILVSRKKPGFNLFAIFTFAAFILINIYFLFNRYGYYFENLALSAYTILESIEIILCVGAIICLACKANCRILPVFFSFVRITNAFVWVLSDIRYFFEDISYGFSFWNIALRLSSFISFIATIIFCVVISVFFIRNGKSAKALRLSEFNPEEELKKLNADFNSGIITEEEYHKKRAEILSRI